MMEEEYPYKLYRVLKGKLYLIDVSKGPDRLLKNLEGLKKYTSEYIVVKTTLEILGRSK